MLQTLTNMLPAWQLREQTTHQRSSTQAHHKPTRTVAGIDMQESARRSKQRCITAYQTKLDIELLQELAEVEGIG